LQGHPGREGILDPFGVIRCQPVLGLQDGDRARLQLIFRQGFDFPDELRPDRGRRLHTELLLDRRGAWALGSELA
jgi:hypothetical protein